MASTPLRCALAISLGACAPPPCPHGCDGAPHLYVLSTIEMPIPDALGAAGFDLDGVASTGEGETCVEWGRDHQSVMDPGETGIDNAFADSAHCIAASYVPDCGRWWPAIFSTPTSCLPELLRSSIADGSLLLVVEISGVDTWPDDDEISVRIHRARVDGCDPADPATCAPRIDEGRLAPDQRFSLDEGVVASSASLRGGRARARVPDLRLAFPLLAAPLLQLPISDVEISVQVAERALRAGALGASIARTDLVHAIDGRQPGLGSSIDSLWLRSRADLAPREDDPEECGRISMGLTFEAVPARAR